MAINTSTLILPAPKISFVEACTNLERAVEQAAMNSGWRPVPLPEDQVPKDIPAMRQYMDSRAWGYCSAPFPVWEGASDNTLYSSPMGNYRFRMLHDLEHVYTGHGFDVAGENYVHLSLYYIISPRSQPDETLALYLFDSVGQTLWHYITGRHVENQREFAQHLWQVWEFRMQENPDTLFFPWLQEEVRSMALRY